MDSKVPFPEHWTAPPELAGPLPRTIRIRKDGIALIAVGTATLFGFGWKFVSELRQDVHRTADPFWWIPCILLAFLTALGLWPLMLVRLHRRLVSGGFPAAAVVVGCRPGGRGGWRAKYQFRTENGIVVEGDGVIGQSPAIGSTLCVVYLPKSPQRNQLYSNLMYHVGR